MGFVENVVYGPMVGDPDDHRPNTEWAIAFDPVSEGSPVVSDLTCLLERIAPGDAIPLHTHATSEVVFIDGGSGLYRLGSESRRVDRGTIVFIPADMPHGLRNDDDGPLELRAVFPSRELDITYLERNAAPGTDGHDPQPPMRFDPRLGSP